jgi:hypothetical protein
MTPATPITIQIDAGEQIATTWGAFIAANDEDTVAEQIAADNYAEIGGGAAPIVWVFA